MLTTYGESTSLATKTEVRDEAPLAFEVKNLHFYYANGFHALREISFPVYKNSVTAIIGPSGCGKTTLLRCFNRMHDLYPGNRYEGEIPLHGINILSWDIKLRDLRSRIGMVFQKPAPFPVSVFDNVSYGLRLRGINNKDKLSESVERALRDAALWKEVKDKLHSEAHALSMGQQQRLAIARSLAVRPEVLLFDEPTSALDHISASKIEDLIVNLKKEITIVVVTHNIQQAARISDWTGFMMPGELIEFNETVKLLHNSSQKTTKDYISGRIE